ncbi:two-component system sensor histidine kinase NtrB [Rhodopirellula halodulae]|uniref:two-component system sensor histidine kinase NtrB n=1 Tax=Rhodopirellula halodulae TaxID=2894198 RepID=UPI001E300962|nr:PAS domain-containing protein [Rhodopirellula sp. JC737]MCC9658693.1 PAS domain-containing protein [Rhodopirellula sp. JC737]
MPEQRRIAETNALFQQRYETECAWVHRFMAWIMVGQWALGLAFAAFLSPYTWIGERQEIHIHVWAALLIGTSLSGFALYWMRLYPKEASTRHVVAIVQMLWSALLIHLSGGRIETHFHVFASLAILSIYRDWKILISATVVVAIDHFVRGVFYPLSVFGILTESPYRWIEHAAWVLFEVAFLAPGCYRLRKEVYELCARQLELQDAKRTVDQQVAERTRELSDAYELLAEKTAETEKLALVARYTDNAVLITDADSQIEWVNEGFTRITGYALEEVIGKRPLDFLHGPQTDPQIRETIRNANQHKVGFNVHTVNYRKDGQPYWVDIEVRPIRDADGEVRRFIGIQADVTERVTQEREKIRLHQELLDVSRQAGMAEIATGVLHNVGNILNSVNVSVSVIRNQCSKSALGHLQKVTDLIAEHESTFADFVSSDQRGKKIPSYVQRVTQALGDERQTIDEELVDLTKNIEHIREIVTMQQSMARTGNCNQRLELDTMIEDALAANKASLMNHQIRVIKELDDDAAVIETDKHRLLQILINLIKNAKDSMVEHGVDSPQITIRSRCEDEQLVLSVIDNGMGISRESLQQIFQHGYTTKDDGHGFGLHSSANAAGELGGRLEAFSDGIGTGARFDVTLPLNPPKSGIETKVFQATS